MTCGHPFSPPTPSRPALAGRVRRRWPAAGAGLLLAAALGLGPGSSPAGAASDPPADPPPDPPKEHRHVVARLCDPSGCYVAWRIVDSDGASDADELMAGTDPYDPLSRPSLTVVVELGADRKLPSFEAGLGAFQLFPPEIVEMLSKAHPDLLSAFPLFERKDTLTRLGISEDQLKAAGVDPERAGLTVGLDRPGSGPDGLPARRIAGMDARLISAGESDGSRSWVTSGSDGSTTTWTALGDGEYVGARTNADGSPGDTRYTRSSSETLSDGSTLQTVEETTVSPDGQVLGQSRTTTIGGHGRPTTSTKTNATYQRDSAGKVTGVRVVRTSTTIGADGTSGTSDTDVADCDENGENCQAAPSDDHSDGDEEDHDDKDRDGTDDPGHDDPDDGDHGHVDPEQADQYVVTWEAVDGVLRTRGAAVTVVRDWVAPGHDAPYDAADPGTIVLIDAEQAMTYTVMDAPRVTDAQPESRPDLPNPGEGAPNPGGTGGPCNGIC